MKKILSILLTVTMIMSLVVSLKVPTAKAVPTYSFAASTKTLYYYQRPDNTFATNNTWTAGTVAGTRVYTMGTPITITVSDLAIGDVRAEIYDAVTTSGTGSYIETYNYIASNTLTLNVPSANVNRDGPYYIRITDSTGSTDTTTFYIQYNLPDPKVSIPQCIDSQAKIEGYITRASGYPLTADVWVWVVDATDNTLVAVNKIPAGQPTGQYFLTWVVKHIGDYKLGVSDMYPDPIANPGWDYDGMVYKTFSNIPADYAVKVSTYINPVLLYKGQANQPVLLRVLDSNNQPVSSVSWTVTNANVVGHDEVFPGFYRFVITPNAGAVDVRFQATVSVFTHTYTSNLFIINLRDLGLFNPYVDISTSDSPYYFNDIATVVYDKLPCQIGYSFDITPGLWDPISTSKYQVHSSSFKVTGPVYRLARVDQTYKHVQIVSDDCYSGFEADFPEYTLGGGNKYYVYDQGEIKVHFEAVVWEKVYEGYEISKYNACCHPYTKDVEICSVVTCPAVTPTLADGTTTVEVGKKTSLKFSVSSQTAPEDLECGCDWKIYLMYMTDVSGDIITDAFTVDTRFGGTKDVSIILYNAVHDKYYAAGSYLLGQRTRIPDLFTDLGTKCFWEGDPDLIISDHCNEVDIEGIVFNYSNEEACANHLVIKLFGTQMIKGLCGFEYVHPLTYVGIDDISIVAATTALTSTGTIWEGAQDPSEILAGVTPVIDITNPGFSADNGVYCWRPVTWEYYFNDKPLTSITVTASPTDEGYRFVFNKAFSAAGTFKIVGTSYSCDCTEKEVVTLNFEVVEPVFTVQLGLLDGSVIDSDGILTEGFGEVIFVTPSDPRDIDPKHDFANDSWTLNASEVLNDCDLATSYICQGIVPGQCCGKQAISVTGFDNPCVEEAPEAELYFNLNGAGILVTTFKFTPPVIKSSIEDIYGKPLEKAPVTVPATVTHIIVSIKDAHGHGAPDIPVSINVGVIVGGVSGYATSGLPDAYTSKNGEADWLVPLTKSGRYYVEIGLEDSCSLPCGWQYIKPKEIFEAEYVKPVIDTEAPVVKITAPADGAKVSTSTVKITGTVTDNVGVLPNSVFVGTKMADFNSATGEFSAVVDLVEGENTFTVTATDTSNNVGKATVKVTYAVPKVTVVKVQIGSDIMTVNGNAVQIDAPAEIKNNRTFLPLRAISEALGATVDWIAETQGITVTLGDNSIGLQIGNTSAVVNGTVMTLDAAPYIKNNRTMVPFRVIAEGLGATVEWDTALRVVTVTLAQ